MFTGLIENVGTVLTLEKHGAGALICVSTALPMSEIAEGDSIAVSGACLTVTSKGAGRFTADVSAETLDRTTLSKKKPGERVNLERAMPVGGRLGGHFVYGHVDGTGTVRESRSVGDGRVFHIRADANIMKYLVFKGSVAVDGVSLTISAVLPGAFEVALIPLTLEWTTFGILSPGDPVNIETDIIGKYVHKLMGRDEGGVSIDFLKEHGFA
ncbi:MAG TPA: riboflavin synthase [Candidatus Deferrimicrobiaceae bacterium]|jgi:riboflavin synthase